MVSNVALSVKISLKVHVFIFSRSVCVEVDNCPQNKFRCMSGECLPSSKYCNYIADCSDGSDELNCGECLYSPILKSIVYLPSNISFFSQYNPILLSREINPYC